MAYHNLTKTRSPFWWEPSVTKLIADARSDPTSRSKLTELVYRPAFRRLDAWFVAAGLKKLNLEADEIFDALWVRDLPTAIDHVTFRDRQHFLKVVLLRARQAAHRAARRIRTTRTESLIGVELDARESLNPGVAAEHAEMIGRLLSAMQRLGSPLYEIVNLHFIEGLTIRQIADELKLPRSTVHRHMQAALIELRNAISNGP